VTTEAKEPVAEDLLAKREELREQRRLETRRLWSLQKVKDLDAIETVEASLGNTNVAILDVEYTAGLPACCACRTPSDPEMKRYRHSAKPKRQDEPLTAHAAAAAEELAAVVLVYPAPDVFAEMCAARPGIKAQLGSLSLKLATGRAETEGKG
jgi:hypothetical protein